MLERGQIVEFGHVEDVFAKPQHIYTRSLIQATPNFQVSGLLLPAGAGSTSDPTDDASCCR
ncbi:ABC transporter ATP-binding protein [Pseudarthrobacter phenanthrenivorans]|uniref:ABC transporter ATP-binding protein n=1 Tax=Pseudarthrobacter phenanthrenivorans TaxID=361575 RepID=UPI0034E85FD0